VPRQQPVGRPIVGCPDVRRILGALLGRAEIRPFQVHPNTCAPARGSLPHRAANSRHRTISSSGAVSTVATSDVTPCLAFPL